MQNDLKITTDYSVFAKKLGDLNEEEFLFCMKYLKRYLKDKGCYGRVKNYMGPITYDLLMKRISKSVDYHSCSRCQFFRCLGLCAFVGHTYLKDNRSWSEKVGDIYFQFENHIIALIKNDRQNTI